MPGFGSTETYDEAKSGKGESQEWTLHSTILPEEFHGLTNTNRKHAADLRVLSLDQEKEMIINGRVYDVSAFIKRLAKRGHLERTPMPTDRRSFRIALTEGGLAALRDTRVRYEVFGDRVERLLGENLEAIRNYVKSEDTCSVVD